MDEREIGGGAGPEPRPNRLRPEDRYRRDPTFRHVVDALTHLILGHEMTPTEVREAAMLAAIQADRTDPRPLTILWRPDGSMDYLRPGTARDDRGVTPPGGG